MPVRVKTLPCSPPPFSFAAYLNDSHSVMLNGVYAVGGKDSQFLPVTTTGSQRQTLPIMFALNSQEDAIAFYHANTFFASETPLCAESVKAVGSSAVGHSSVYTDLVQSKALSFYDELCSTVPVIYVVLEGWAPGIYFDEEQARWAMLNFDRATRSGFALQGGIGGLQAAILCYTSGGMKNNKLSVPGAVQWTHLIPDDQVGGTLSRLTRPHAVGHINLSAVDIPPVNDHNALVYGGKDLIAAEDVYQFQWTKKHVPAPATPAVSPAVSPASLTKRNVELQASTPASPPPQKRVPSMDGIQANDDSPTIVLSSDSSAHLVNSAVRASLVWPSSPASYSSLSSRGPGPSSAYTKTSLRGHYTMLPIPEMVKLYIRAHFEEKDRLEVISMLQEAISYSDDIDVIHGKYSSLPSYFHSAEVFDVALRVYFMAIDEMLA
ncbi:hypothetical protein CYLTODRAFT_447523 [Cylindrobasidium torrendii FP15055 ss-10]|uniref:Uncharacterized protein n=1 Tax=Cylindrobasidium torrendii FP15055 ss-10 TaxID=1314674 RepID=A0A0D7AUE0_9AGAR|nr:hypothetical protein CYLTODRAFT_447523 [Cylindrobasidium torrendii FP15055 ss-10]